VATFNDVIKDFLNGSKEGVSTTGTLKIKDEQLIHYYTPILERYDGKLLFNVTRYSLATGKLQKLIKEELLDKEYIEVNKVKENYKGSLVDCIEK